MIELSGPEITPASGNQAKQLVIMLHGVGADGNDLISLAAEFDDTLPDAHFISPNAPFKCDMADFGYQWFSLRDRAPEKFMLEVKESAPILDNFISKQLARFGLNEPQLILIGFSQGTMMGLYVALRRTIATRAIIGYSGMLLGWETLTTELLSKPNICLVHGDKDFVVPYAFMPRSKQTLEKHGISVQTHTREGLGHSIDEGGIEIGKAFITQTLEM